MLRNLEIPSSKLRRNVRSKVGAPEIYDAANTLELTTSHIPDQGHEK